MAAFGRGSVNSSTVSSVTLVICGTSCVCSGKDTSRWHTVQHMWWRTLLWRFCSPLRWLSTLIRWIGTRSRVPDHRTLQNNERYRYGALSISKKEIRLLSIDAILPDPFLDDCSGILSESNRSILVSLTHAPLHEAGKYVALSYTWGCPTLTRSISIDGKSLGITQNLYEALIHLHKAKITRLWIDAVCINQEDELERGLQVQRMGDIYREADEVVSWIGIHENDSAALFKWIKISQLNGMVFDNSVVFSKWVNTGNFHEDISIPLQYEEALIELAKRPYFRRMWVLQEFACARRVRIMCGDDFQDPEPLTGLFYRYASAAGEDRYAPAASLVMLKQIRDIFRGSQLGLLDLLMHISSVYEKGVRNTVHNFQSTDFIDQVYGLLGMVYDGRQFVPDPDYILTMNDLFEYMTRSIIKSTRRLDYIMLEVGESIPNFANFGASDPKGYEPARLPSWCPDYVNLIETPINAELTSAVDLSSTPSHGMTLFRHRYGKRRLYWHATRTSELDDTNLWTDDSKQMHIPGMPVGTSLACPSASERPNHAVIAPTELDSNPTSSGLTQLLFTYSELPIPSPSDAIMTLYVSLIVMQGDRFFLNDGRLFFQERVYQRRIHDEFTWLFKWAMRREYYERLPEPATAEWDRICELSRNLTESVNKNYDDFRRRVGAFSPNTLAKTVVDVVERYGAFAWIPQVAEPGDEIWLLKGCSVPVALRRVVQNDDSNTKVFTIVGPSVVNGAMDGDMWCEDDLSSITIM